MFNLSNFPHISIIYVGNMSAAIYTERHSSSHELSPPSSQLRIYIKKCVKNSFTYAENDDGSGVSSPSEESRGSSHTLEIS